jgi:cyanophycinase-like exopeptidase
MPGPGLIALVGGDEFKPGNEEQDRMLVEGARKHAPAYVVPTAAARQGPEEAVAHAVAWFGSLGLSVQPLPVLKPADAKSREIADAAREGGFFYLVGGDPGLVAQVLRESRVWEAITEAWLGGAALAGSSAGAMAMCEHTLIRAAWPDRSNLRPPLDRVRSARASRRHPPRHRRAKRRRVEGRGLAGRRPGGRHRDRG